MGLFGTAIAFVGGYVAGMKLGDRPLAAARSAADEARQRASSLSEGGGSIRSKLLGGTVDLRSVRDVMTGGPETVTQQTPLAEAAGTMERADIGDVLVVDASGKLTGILTDRDIAIRAVAAGKDPKTTTVGDVMTPSVATISPSASVQEAVDLMHRHNIRRLPVVEGEKAIGVVSLGDLSTTPQARGLLADISTSPPNN
jgi:CBS domain-containing protein